MPGGSVNGRPFREDPDSFELTGIPRGHPKRYECRSVLRLTQTGPPNKKQAFDTPPTEDIETEADRQLKRLVNKQLDTNVTLQEFTGNKKQFSEATVYKPLSSEVSGSMTFKDFHSLSTKDKLISDWRAYGLTQDEIELKLKHAELTAEVKSSSITSQNEAELEKLKLIEQKIKDKEVAVSKQTTFSGTKKLNRHEMDLEKAITKGDKQSQMLGCLLTEQKPQNDNLYHPNHPINHLDDLVKKFSKSNSECLGRRVRRRAKRLKRVEMTDTELHCQCCSYDEPAEPTVDWVCQDAKQGCAIEMEESPDSDSNDVEQTQDLIGPQLRPIVIESIPEDVIVRYRLTLNEIKQISRFRNYEKGIPSKTLFLKNLSPKVAKEDLMSIFMMFEENGCDEIEYRLLTGRMKGQAFVQFPSIDTAHKALDLVNGYKFKGKPIIIEYGKQSN